MKGIVLAILAVLFLSIGGGCGYGHNDIDRDACMQFCSKKGGKMYGFASGTEGNGYCACFWNIPRSHVELEDPAK